MDAVTSKKFGHVKTLTKKLEFELKRSGVLFVNLVSTVRWLCLLKEQTRPNRRSFLTTKMAVFDKISHKKFKFYFLVKILTYPNYLNVRASTDVKSGQKFGRLLPTFKGRKIKKKIHAFNSSKTFLIKISNEMFNWLS